MIQTGDIAEVKIERIAFGGDGVGYLEDDGRIVFVPFAARGDELKVRITQVQKSFTRASIEEIVVPGESRTKAPCEYYGKCGGCVYQHLNYDEQTEIKQLQFIDVLTRLGGLKDLPEVEAFTPSPKPYGYRNKLRLEPLPEPVDVQGRTILDYGFCELDNSTFFRVTKCLLGEESLADMLDKIPKTRWGCRNATRKKPRPMTVRKSTDEENQFYFGSAPDNIPWLKEELFGKIVHVPLNSFWQVNNEVAESLLAKAREWYADCPKEVLIDAYAGVGTFSLVLGDQAKRNILIECDQQAMKAAELNHQEWGIKNVRIIPGTTERNLSKVLRTVKIKKQNATVVLDPPRSGCKDVVINNLMRSTVKNVIYISCNPSTLARDLKQLCGKGNFKVKRLAAFDMFPQTAHFESMVLLER